jgi:PhnB protein
MFTKDVANKKLHITRTFDAPVDLVWKAWTESEILDQWWAPAPWKTETKFMDFSEGGHWLYSMNGPEGEKHWARIDYEKIAPEKQWHGQDAVCDAEGNINNEFPSMQWTVKFTKTSGGTEVVIDSSFPSIEDMDKIIEMGFKEGFASAHDNLDILLAEMVQEEA